MYLNNYKNDSPEIQVNGRNELRDKLSNRPLSTLNGYTKSRLEIRNQNIKQNLSFIIWSFKSRPMFSVLSVNKNLQLQTGCYWSFSKLDSISYNFISPGYSLTQTILRYIALEKQINNYVQISNFWQTSQNTSRIKTRNRK